MAPPRGGAAVGEMHVVVDVAHYPFLVSLGDYVSRRYGVRSPLTLLRMRRDLLEYAVKRLSEAVKRGRVGCVKDTEKAVIGHHAAVMIAAALGDRWLASRLALAEAEHSYSHLLEEEEEVVGAIGGLLGVGLRPERPCLRQPLGLLNGVPIYREYCLSITMPSYLRAARRLLGDPAWKPINLPVRGGRVYLDKRRAARVLKEVIQSRIEERVRGMMPLRLPDDMSWVLEEARSLLSEARRPRRGRGGRVSVPKGVVDPDAFPPCMAGLYEALRRGENLSHHARFAIATFLLNIGMGVDEVVDLFRNTPDFNERIARYQVEHLAGMRGSGKKYKTYSCEKMKTLGLCTGDCGTRSPLQAYYRRLASKLRGK